MFSFFMFCFKSSEYVVYEVRWRVCWSGALRPSEGEFLSSIFLCVRVGNNLYL